MSKGITLALALTVISLFAPGGTALALTSANEPPPAPERQAELYHAPQERREVDSAGQITDWLRLSGLIEIEAAAERNRFQGGHTDSASELTLATAQLGLELSASEQLVGDLILLFEEDSEGDDRVEVDEAAVNLSAGAFSGRIGRQYLPFGRYHSHFISDPLILELGETRGTALVAGYAREPWSLSAFVYDGRAERDGGETHIDDFGASLQLRPCAGLALGASYLSDLADSGAELADDYRHRVGGWSAYAIGDIGPLQLSGEMLGALRPFAAADLDTDGNGKGDRPQAWNLELAYYPRPNFELALRLEGCRELTEQPERQYGAAVSWSPRPQLSLTLEYLRGEFDKTFAAVDKSEQPQNWRDLITTRLALDF